MNALPDLATARNSGLRFYWGRPCKRGHDGKRYTRNKFCVTCQADKGREYKRQYPERVRGAQRRCYAKRRSNGKRLWASAAIGGARERAKEKEYAFDIDINFVLSITPDDCPVFGWPLTFSGGLLGNKTATIDRIDSSKGYVRGNVAVICWLANSIKKHATAEQIRRVADWLVLLEDARYVW